MHYIAICVLVWCFMLNIYAVWLCNGSGIIISVALFLSTAFVKYKSELLSESSIQSVGLQNKGMKSYTLVNKVQLAVVENLKIQHC